jgi:uncharacterized protein YbjQ (UPF0145 family)
MDENTDIDPDYVRRAFRVLAKLVAGGALLPYSLYIREVYELVEDQPVFFGGFSDVFHARSAKGREVALKRLRINARKKDKDALLQVSLDS